MGASLSLSISETNLNKSDNTSQVTVKVYCTATGETYNSYSRNGTVKIDGSSYSFSSSFKKGTTTLLTTRTKTVKHDSSGGGRITVSASYSTGVSVGTISTSRSYTLKTIDRTYIVTYYANGGSDAPSSQTKTYGKSLTLSTKKPSRTGYTFQKWNTKSDGTGTSYNSGASYTANANVVLYAIWKENSAVVKFTTTILPKPSDITMYFTRSYTYPTISTASANCGYHLRAWSDKGVEKTPGSILKTAHTSPSSRTISAIEEPNRTITTFYTKTDISSQGWIVEFTNTYEYDQSGVVLPVPTNIPEGYKFIGWNQRADYSGTMYLANKNYRWVGSKGADESRGYFYAQYAKIDSYNIIIDYIDTIEDSTINLNSRTLDSIRTGSFEFVIPDLSEDPLPIYEKGSMILKPTNWWHKDTTLQNPNYLEQGFISPIVFPKSFNPTFVDHYCEEYNLVEPGYVLTGFIEEDIHFYPVYIDDSASSISFVSSMYIYVDTIEDPITHEQKLETSLEQYYSYIIGRSTIIDYALIAQNYMAAFVFSSKSAVSVNTNNVKFFIKKGSSETEVTEYNIITRTLVGTTETYYYILISSKLDNAFEDTNYILTISNLYDSNGQLLEDQHVTISPPDVIRDINANGKVVSYFKYANENPRIVGATHELDVNGAIVAKEGYYILDQDDNPIPLPVIEIDENGIHANLVGNVNAKNENENGLVETDNLISTEIESETISANNINLIEHLQSHDVALKPTDQSTDLIRQLITYLNNIGIIIDDIRFSDDPSDERLSLVKILINIVNKI